MLSPTYHVHRLAPPVRPSRSLEGLERVIPPYYLKQPPFSPSRSELFLNKPLPAEPLPEDPTEEYSGMWSDSSDSESTVDSIASPSDPRNSTESYPIFVSSSSDDFSDLVDHPTPHTSKELGKASTGDDDDEDVHSIAEKSDAQYGRLSHWSQNRSGTNHYFREKKWDFFPELATPSALQASGRTSPSLRSSKARKKDGRLNLAAKRRRWHSLDRAGLGLAYGVCDSIKTHVHRTLSRESTEPKPKDSPRPATAPMDRIDLPTSSARSGETVSLAPSSTDMNLQFRALSISTLSSTSEVPPSPRSVGPRQKQLAVPLSPYQKYGSAVWETPKTPKPRSLRLPRHSKHATPSSSSSDVCIANPTPPLSPPLKLHLQQGSRDAMRALQGARRKMVESKDDRRRELLKSQIRLVGPVNPHTCLQADPWL
ncbi:hypothetical protein N7462_002019 [Penicillium macrosclerotiorum]|uniref:uncharacterized protein n=1 Tax=Penicillium macrosclerotiorum TaxID=303699 RepID=UPI002548E2CD|nr:uncharacterized protein N7462_002019 [Penicillium macrosclerotiorum]KAJ5692596.1 hypothetical protein N7462_002019 [Penicillium macrosclerotiorum]